MKYKLIFGILLPLLIIIALAIIASYGDIKEEKKFFKEISAKEITSENKIRDSVKIGSIRLINNYSLAKRHNFPLLGACLVDKEENKGILEAGSVEYSEGDYVYGDFEEPFRIRSNEYRSVEVKSKSEKNINIYLRPSYEFSYKNYTQLVEEYREYDYIIIYEKEKINRYNYINCYNLDTNLKDKAVKINIVY